MSTKKLKVRCLALAAGLTLLAAACGSTSGTSTSQGPATSAAPGTTAAPPKGAPLKFGSVLTIKNPSWDNSPVKNINEVWSKYINEQLGGIGGRPVEVQTCDDEGDAAKASQCVANLLDSGIVGFVNTSSLVVGANALPAIEKANMANVGGWPITPAEYASAVTFPTIAGAAGSYPSILVTFRAMGKKNIGVIYTQTAAAQKVAEAQATAWKDLGGESSALAAFDPTAADFTPVMNDLVAKNVDSVVLLIGSSAAPRMFQAAQVAGLNVPMGTTGTAATQAVFDAAGPAANGIYFALPSLPDLDNNDSVKKFKEVMQKYSPDTKLTSSTGTAASSMQYLYDVASRIKGEITPASLLAEFKKGTPWKGFLTHSLDPKFAPDVGKQLWNPYVLVAKYDNGSFTPLDVQMPPELAKHAETEQGVLWIAGNTAGDKK